jgi:hypothetical protein
MKKIVLVVLLAAAGCSKKGTDCDAAIAKGMDNFTATTKERAPNPKVLERMMGMVDKLKSTLTERCKADGWSAEVVTCFTTVTNRKDMQACQSKLTPEQQSKLTSDLMQVMTGAGGMRPGGMGAMPPGMAGHPGTLAPGGSAAGDPAAPGAPAGSPAAPPATDGAGGAGAAPPAPSGAPTPPATPPTPPAPPASGSGAK